MYMLLHRRRKRDQSYSIENPELESEKSEVLIGQVNEEDRTF